MQSIKNILLAATVATLAASPAFAGDGHGKGHQGGKKAEHHAVQKHSGKHHSGKATVHRDDRVARLDPRVDTRVLGAAGCPPGLAKKDNGCLPPGQAKKVIVGQAIPPGAVYVIPSNVMATLPPAPVGYRYAIVNNQVVLVSRGDIVVDIIRSLLG